MRILSTLAALAATVSMLAPAAAHDQSWAAPLLGSSEVPVAATPGHGQATVTIDFDLVTLRVQASFADLLGNVTAAHIHCCTAAGTNIPPATQTPSFAGFPIGVTAGSYDQTFDMTLASSYNASFIGNNGGTVGSAFNALVAGLDAGKAYLNLHTSSFPSGEIRGLLAPVPEPASYALMAGGLVMLALLRRRRQP